MLLQAFLQQLFINVNTLEIYLHHRKVVLKTSVTTSFAAVASASFSNVTQKGLFYCIAEASRGKYSR
jgi:hypothetical protein